MLKKRLIPCLFLKNGRLVRSEKFSYHQVLGNPITQVERINSWSADELIYIDISDDQHHDLQRDDHKIKSMDSIYQIIETVSKTCFIPLTFGGNIKNIADIRERLKRGADKVIINTAVFENPDFITKASKAFGRQCIVVGIDVKINEKKEYEVYVSHGKKPTGLDPVFFAEEVEKRGAGEIFLNSIDRDGSANGYDIKLIKMVVKAVSIPVIACGGVGEFSHFVDGIKEGGASAVSAGNIFNFTENSVIEAKKTLKNAGIDIRPIINLSIKNI
ncbi:MAG: imidazole glycerol phosphate synthase subunit HisF [Candidatus Staskawiczbacteria bacterium]|nr:imidazole glycerol phosphate synthase subunit HisF [Candidatus Staskawiczbacteria bacterium]MBI3337249.1 imidazole glycerol phosphate synthase subunit HisF [Candidatus Staskawiczbacteria bacterium]